MVILKEKMQVTANCVSYKKQYLKNYCPLGKTEIQRQNRNSNEQWFFYKIFQIFIAKICVKTV